MEDPLSSGAPPIKEDKLWQWPTLHTPSRHACSLAGMLASPQRQRGTAPALVEPGYPSHMCAIQPCPHTLMVGRVSGILILRFAPVASHLG